MGFLKNEFNLNITKSSKGTKITEVLLFDCLYDALLKYGAYGRRCHGKPGFVNFDVILPMSKSTLNCTCEICDLFLIFYYKDQIRFTFLQNKYSKSVDEHVIKQANCRQHYLLHNRPILLSTPKCISVDRNVLCNASLSGVSSYGDFYKDDKDYFDMRFFVAKLLIPKKKYNSDTVFTVPGKKRDYVCSIDDDHALISHPANKLQKVYCSNLDTFEMDINKALIGTYVDLQDNSLAPFVKAAIYYVLINNGGNIAEKIMVDLSLDSSLLSEFENDLSKMNIMFLDLRK